jgi:imidazoleglycerol-phosphate dehydratase/histidinol-phosphatase
MTPYLFVDRDGTLLVEPADFQIDSLEKFQLVSGVIPSLCTLQQAGYRLVMVSNQDGLGTAAYPQAAFDQIQHLLLGILQSQGIRFEQILICPHLPAAACKCRKPQTALLHEYLASNEMDRQRSYVIGDRLTDLELAENLGLVGLRLSPELDWPAITQRILRRPRTASVSRITKETRIELTVSLDGQGDSHVHSGQGFLDHMLEQLARHGGFTLRLQAQGDLHIDDHHLVEDVALALGQALRQALGDKRGIGRYGFVLPMDEACCQVAIDLSGRAYFKFRGDFPRPAVGGLATEMVPHFFRSLADALAMSLHIELTGENTHHMVESMFKAVGRALRQALLQTGDELPSTKGVL